MQVVSLHRYPVKGFSPERLPRIALEPGGYVPGDRLYAIENGPSGFDPVEPRHQPKIKFLMLMRNAAVARVRTSYDDETATLSATVDGRTVRADLSRRDGRLALEAFIRQVLPRDLRGPPKVLEAPDGFRFTDSRRGYVSLINVATVQALETLAGRPVDPLRFRGNVLVRGLPAWAEFDLVGTELAAPSGLRPRVTKPIDRCAAIDVDPETGERDLALPPAMMRTYGHAACGIYLEVRTPGSLAEGERLSPVAERQASLPFGS